jgi:carbonic anhydrase
MIDEILAFNREFVKNRGYEKYITTKYPNKKVAVLSCMDTRLTELLPAALGLKNGDAKMIKNAGAVISHPFGSVMRSLIVAIYDLGVEEILVVGHYDCGMQGINVPLLLEKMKNRNISQEKLELVHRCGIDFNKWLLGFSSVEDSVRESVAAIVNHPLIPDDVRVFGFIIRPETGELTPVR